MRRCVACAVVVYAVAAAVACGSMESADFGGSGYSDAGAGRDGGGGGPDAGFLDGGEDTSASDGGGPDGGPPAPTTVLFVQGSPNLWPGPASIQNVRVCWSVGGVVTKALPFPSDGPMPGSNYDGLPLGGAASLSDATSLMNGPLTLHVIDALTLRQLASPTSTCDELYCPTFNPSSTTCLAPGSFTDVPVRGAGQIAAHETNVLALAGCAPSAADAGVNLASCGADWNPTAGNLHADLVVVSSSAPSPGTLAVQAAQLSPGLAALTAGGATATVSFGAAGAADASTVGLLTGEGALAPLQYVPLGSGLAVYGQVGFSVSVPTGDGGALSAWMSLAQSQQLVDPTQDPTVFFGAPRTYVVAVVGDPLGVPAFAADASYDGTGLHVLVLPTPAPPVPADR
ncbi:MAG TPA: hypothetical protein VIY73_27610 [Polyangiaceae bacterium]